MTTAPAVDPVQLDQLQAWCLGEPGRTAARSELRRLGLPADADRVDDLCATVLEKVWRRLLRRPLDPHPDGGSTVAAYARRATANAAMDLVRRGSADRLASLVDPTSPEGHQVLDAAAVDEPLDDADDGTPDLGEASLEPALRATLHRFLAERNRRLQPWTIGAALVVVRLGVEPDLELRPGTPEPDPRSPAQGSGPRWAALAYAGRDDCFATPESGAVRERRATALRRVDATLREAATVARSGAGPS